MRNLGAMKRFKLHPGHHCGDIGEFEVAISLHILHYKPIVSIPSSEMDKGQGKTAVIGGTKSVEPEIWHGKFVESTQQDSSASGMDYNM